MVTLSRLKPNRGSVCHRCQFIRAFIMMALMIVIFGLIAGDKAVHLSVITTERVAAAILIGGSIMFLFKLLFWRLEQRAIDSELTGDPEQGEQLTADMEKSGHM
ncbi:hypothetical protein N9X12_00145 [Alphaproteobacteria bacterium]|nr:hypothetical protein [Alphaproteobacteria bacterium]